VSLGANSRITGKPEVIGSSVGLVLRNALKLSGLANFEMLGYPETAQCACHSLTKINRSV
jgi:hypothetical protein